MIDLVQQYPNAYGHPETSLREDHAKGSTSLKVENCPIGVRITGPKCQVKVGMTCYNVLDIGDPPYIDWEVEPGVEETEDDDYDAGTPLYVPITRGAMEDIRARTYITRVDERVHGYPNTTPLEEVSLSELGDLNHGYLSGVDRNQHHFQMHRHDNPDDGVDLYPASLQIQQYFAIGGVAVINELTADVDDFTPVEGMDYTVWLLSSDATRHITGISIGQEMSRLLIFINIGSNDIVLDHDNHSSLFANRIKVSGNANKTLATNGVAMGVWAGDPGVGGQQWHVW